MVRDRVVVVTGASDGIGAVAARRLSAQGARVVLVGRSPEKTRAVAEEIGAPYYLADFARLDDVRALAARLEEDLPHIDVLANNAGGVMGGRELTVDGHEKTLQVNHLAPFLLTESLVDVLEASGAVVVNTSSVANRLLSDFDIDDLELEKGYTPNRAYGNAKLANILFTKELHRRYHGRGISTAAFHPGNVATNFASDTTSPMRFVYHTPLRRLLLVSPEKGAHTLVWLASAAPGEAWASGEYYEKRKPSKTAKEAHDAGLAAELWRKSAEMVGA